MKRHDYTNEHVGMLQVQEVIEDENGKMTGWKCLCDCGKVVVRDSGYLRQVGVASCGCYAAIHHKKKRRDISKQRFGKLEAIEPTEKKSKSGSVIWRFKCDCGNIVEIPLSEVTKRNNPTQSCGCSKAWFIGNPEHGKKYFDNLEKNLVMGTNLMEIRREDTDLTRANTSGYQGVSFISTRNVWVAYCKFQGYCAQKTCHSMEEAVEVRKTMRAIRDEFLEWYDSLSEEEKEVEAKKYKNRKEAFKDYYKKRTMELLQQ